jgi:GntR family transcriptional regulator of vanillate catabolism
VNSQLSQAIVCIREMILRSELLPGQRVAEAPLAVRLGMSRTPVRQALPLLAQEGLLLEHETRGFVVRAFTASDIVDAIDLRAALEGLAVRRLAERGVPKTTLGALQECLESGDAILRKRRVEDTDEARYADMNVRFHALIVAAAGSSLLSEALQRNNRIPFAGAQAVAFDRTHLDRMYDMLAYAHRQHHAIVECLEAGHGARAEALMREHANATKSSLNVAALPVIGVISRVRVVRGG